MNNQRLYAVLGFWVGVLVLMVALGCAPVEHHEPSDFDDIASNQMTFNGPATVNTPKGMHFSLPEGFQANQDGAFITILDPEREIDFYILEVDGNDCKAAARQIWEKSEPVARWRLEKSMSPPSHRGYDEIYIENYTIPKTKRFAQIIAYRKDKTIWTGLIRTTLPVLDKRCAQISYILSSVKVPAIKDVDLNDRTPVPIAVNLAAFDTFIEDVMQKTRTPGLSIAVVEGDRIVYTKGFGVRELGRDDPVTPDTLMMIGSVTKSLTTLLMATLVDDSVFSWTDPVVDIDPSFRLGDAGLTRELHMEHLACACAGLPRKDLPMVLDCHNKSSSDVFDELAVMTPSTRLKETFQYQNHMVAAAGYIAARALYPTGDAGIAYDRAMQTRIFGPMGMTSSTFDFEKVCQSPDKAMPHCMDANNQIFRLPLESEYAVRYVRPAGGVWSTARDMAAYILTELNDGISPDARRVVSAKNLRYRRQPQVATSAEAAYGLGWGVRTYKGVQVIGHGGGTMGFATLLNFLPEKKLGVVMIANGTGGHQAEYFIWKQLMKFWFKEKIHVDRRLAYQLAEAKKNREAFVANLSTPDKKWMSRYLGTYANDEIGDIAITEEDDGYTACLNTYRTRLMKYQREGENPSLVFMTPPLYGVSLQTNGASDDTFKIIRAQEEYLFSRISE